MAVKQQLTKMKSYLRTIGEGIQNLLNVFFIFSCKADSSRHHVVGSVADGPAVGSAYTKIHSIFYCMQVTLLFVYSLLSSNNATSKKQLDLVFSRLKENSMVESL